MTTGLEEGLAIVRDTSRLATPDRSRYRASRQSMKNCLNCNHWSFLHPEHGPCKQTDPLHGRGECPCTEFGDPEPGRPDVVYTRDQIERMRKDRWEPQKHLIYLMKDGRYGRLDRWTDKEKYFA